MTPTPYNGANRPIRFRNEETDTTVDCGYDSQGRRYFKKVTVAGTTTLHHRYIYRGYLQIACVDCTRSGHPALWLVTWDPSQPTATRPLAIQKDGTWFTYGYDITKNICEVFGQHGYIRTAYSYAPFGAVTESGDVTQPFQWSSEHYDSELDLVYYNYRHYSPSLGRFLSRDPIAEQGGRNLYAFVKNKVAVVCDSLGNSSVSVGEQLSWQESSHLTTCENDYQREITDFFSYSENVSAFSWTLSTTVTTITPFACAVSCYTSTDNWEDNQPPQEGNALSCSISGKYSSSGFSLQLPSFGAATSDKFVAMASFDFSASYEISESTSLSLSVSGRAPLTNIGDAREWIQNTVDSLSLGIRVVITF